LDEILMSSSGYFADDPIFAALQALHCPPEELAQALGIDLNTLWGYYGGEARVPAYVTQRLVLLLEDRAWFLREVAAILAGGRGPRTLAAVS
jgi:hypothetical protein